MTGVVRCTVMETKYGGLDAIESLNCVRCSPSQIKRHLSFSFEMTLGHGRQLPGEGTVSTKDPHFPTHHHRA